MAGREDLHELIEELPEGELKTARRLLQHLRTGINSKEELLTADELAEISEARQEIKAGQWFTLNQIERENDL